MNLLKKSTLFFLLSLLPLISNAQWINGLTVSPANPSESDTIYVFANCSFPSGNCNEYTQILTYAPGEVNAYALHCLGALSFICPATDTFVIPPLAAGAYEFKLQLNYGALPSPCTPGIAPGPSDSVQFTVGNTSGIPDQTGPANNFNIINSGRPGLFLIKYPLQYPGTKPVSIEITSLTGAKIKTMTANGDKAEINLSFLSKGMYLIRVEKRKMIKVIIS